MSSVRRAENKRAKRGKKQDDDWAEGLKETWANK